MRFHCNYKNYIRFFYEVEELNEIPVVCYGLTGRLVVEFLAHLIVTFSEEDDVCLLHYCLIHVNIIFNLLFGVIQFEIFIFFWTPFIAVILSAWNPVGLSG